MWQTAEPNRKFCSVRGRSNRTFGRIFGKMRHYFSTLVPGRGPFPSTSKFPKFGLQNLPKGTTCFICVSRPAHASIWASGEKKKKKKKFKENAYLWTSSHGQVLSSTVAEEETDCSTQTTVLWRLMEKVNLLVSNWVVLGGTSLFKMNYVPAGLDCLGCRFYWSTGAAEGLIMVDSEACLRGEIPRKVFCVCDSFCGQNVNVDREEGAGGPTIRRSLSHARLFAMWVCARSLLWRERERERERERANSKKRQKIEMCSSGHPLLVFFAALQDVDLLKMSCFLSNRSGLSSCWAILKYYQSINGVVDGTSGERFLTTVVTPEPGTPGTRPGWRRNWPGWQIDYRAQMCPAGILVAHPEISGCPPHIAHFSSNFPASYFPAVFACVLRQRRSTQS